MGVFPHRFLGRFLVILSGLAMNVCVCARMTGGIVVRDPAISTQADKHSCCRWNVSPKTDSPAPADDPCEPCKSCDAKQPAGITAPQQTAKPQPPTELVAVMEVASDDLHGYAVQQHRVASLEHLIHPLLSDLFHSHCQLTC